jgi:hypothetical protein
VQIDQAAVVILPSRLGPHRREDRIVE